MTNKAFVLLDVFTSRDLDFMFITETWQCVAHQVIEERVSVVLGRSTVLPCKLDDSKETLDQISWQRRTKESTQDENFVTIQSGDIFQFVDIPDVRFQFLGDFSKKNGTLKLSDAALDDEGTYTCIFSLFPSGYVRRVIFLDVLVPPSVQLVPAVPAVGDHEVTLATCIAAGSKPPSEIRWDVSTLGERVNVTIRKTEHSNGTTTTVGFLLGKPVLEIYGHLVRCIISSQAWKREETFSFEIDLYFSPVEVNITEGPENAFQCKAKANPNATITWSRLGQSLPPSVKTKGATLQFLKMTDDLSGLYQCETANPYGKNQARLYVSITSGNCTVCWVLFSFLLVAILLASGYLYKIGVFQRFRGEGHQPVPNSPNRQQSEQRL